MEESKKYQRFYLIIGIATLVVAVIGATFAYFSASVNGNGTPIAGNTLNVTGSNLTLQVDKITYSDIPNTIKNDLVPADVTESEAGWQALLTSKCVDTTAGYTGCHVYRITANTTNNVNNATITLTGSVTGATTTSNWKYVVYEGSQSSITASSARSGLFVGTDTEIYSGSLPTTGVVRYLIVYLLNTNSSQNGVGTGSTIETGTYNGTVTLNAEGGQVKACFTPNGECDTGSSNVVYTVNLDQNRIILGSEIPSGIDKYYDPNGPTQAINALESAYATLNNGATTNLPFFLKHVLNGNNEVTESYVGFMITQAIVNANPNSGLTTGGPYYLEGRDNRDVFLANAKIMYDAFGGVGCRSDGTAISTPYSASYNPNPSSFFSCGVPGMYTNATSHGYVSADGHANSYCQVDYGWNGYSHCRVYVDNGNGGN